MDKIIAMSIFPLICYLTIGFGISAILDTSYDIDIPAGCMFFWPVIFIFIAVLDVIKLTRKLIKSIKT